MKAILLDIEGTTTPIDFVHKVLFPFAKEHIAAYVSEHFSNIEAEIAQLKAEHAADDSYKGDFDGSSPGSVSEYLKYLIEIDRKSTPLKSLQGKIWQKGYESGLLKSDVFVDVPAAFKRWKAAGKIIAIYSSGSILAQKLLFGYTNFGDLNPYISAYFDTTTGGKREASSYRKIAAALGFPQEEILFISDIIGELDAAKEAGMHTLLSMREGNAKISEISIHRRIEDFDGF